MDFTTILVPFDTSKHALRALEIAQSFAQKNPAVTLHIVNVMPISELPPISRLATNPYENFSASAVNPDICKTLINTATEQILRDMKHIIGDRLDNLSNNFTLEVLHDTSVVDGILDYAQKHNCDLIIMGSRGLSRLRGMLGSVSYGVLCASDIPVLIAKK